MKNLCVFFLIVVFFVSNLGGVQTPTGEEILKLVDNNIGSANKISVGKMIVHGRRGSRTMESKTWARGMDTSFTEFLAPAREKGTKMLKLEDQLWTFSPSTDRIIRISGHMLRQSVMGSDLSYEDMMEDPELNHLYSAEVVGEDTMLDRPCWVLELKSLGKDIAYYSRKLWVDQEKYIALKEELFAKSGKLLKTLDVKEVMFIQGRWTAKHIIYKDVLKNGKGTEFILDSVEFDADIPAHIFSKASLRK